MSGFEWLSDPSDLAFGGQSWAPPGPRCALDVSGEALDAQDPTRPLDLGRLTPAVTVPPAAPKTSGAADVVFGSVAGFMGKIVEFPFDTIKVRLQTQPIPVRTKPSQSPGTAAVPMDAFQSTRQLLAQSKAKPMFSGPFDCLQKTIKHEGFFGLYKGLSSPLVGSMLENAILFVSYNQIQTLIRTYSSPASPATEDLSLSQLALAGAASGAVVSLVLTPIELIKCKLQVRDVQALYNSSHGRRGPDTTVRAFSPLPPLKTSTRLKRSWALRNHHSTPTTLLARSVTTNAVLGRPLGSARLSVFPSIATLPGPAGSFLKTPRGKPPPRPVAPLRRLSMRRVVHAQRPPPLANSPRHAVLQSPSTRPSHALSHALFSARLTTPATARAGPGPAPPPAGSGGGGPLSLLVSTVRSQGLSGLYRGHFGTFLRETGGGAAWFGVYELVARSVIAANPAYTDKSSLSTLELMGAGAMAGMGYNAALFPADVIKSRQQTAVGAGLGKGFWATGQDLWSGEGWKGFYRGFGITLVRTVPASAVIFYTYETLSRQKHEWDLLRAL